MNRQSIINILKILSNREGIPLKECAKEYKYLFDELSEILKSGDYFEAEEYFTNNFCLEPDYFFELVC